jgi:NitT/TauT family transport system substrate-binding protein
MLRHLRTSVLSATLLAALPIVAVFSASAATLSPIRYLVPSPINVPAFIPLVLAQHLGYFSDVGYDVTFVLAKGGVDVAKQVGVGNADVGTAIGDTPILVRSNGVRVKVVALFGGGAMTSIVARGDRGIKAIGDLRGKKISVLSFQDTTYYALLGTLASIGIARSDVDIEAVGPAGVTNLLLTGAVDACACVPERAVDVANALPDSISFQTKMYVPSMAQALLAADETIEKRPDLVRAIVAANLRAIRHIGEDPKKAAAEYTEAVPAYRGREAFIEQVMKTYISQVYGGQTKLGEMDPVRLAPLQDVYLKQNIIQKPSAITDLYTNEFLP